MDAPPPRHQSVCHCRPGSACHATDPQPTTPGAFAKAVFVAITCVEAIILCRLRKLVCTVSCCGALRGAQCRRATQRVVATAFRPIAFCANVNGGPGRCDGPGHQTAGY